jgi:hypothetical protein
MSGSVAPRDLISTLDGDLLSGSRLSLFIAWEKPRSPVNTGLDVPQKLHGSCAAEKYFLPRHGCNPEFTILLTIT